jgi:hypothetical protein
VTVKAVFRYVTHSIGLDPAAERDMEEMFCSSCPESSGCVSIDDARDWAMRHTGRTKHDGFRLETTNYYRVTRHDGRQSEPAPVGVRTETS